VSRQHDLEELADAVTQLLDHVDVDETIDWRPTRHGLNLPDGARLPAARRERITRRDPGLLSLLADEAGRRPVIDITRRRQDHLITAAALPALTSGAPGSNPPDSAAPPGSSFLETLADLTAAIHAAHQDTRRHLGLPAYRRPPSTSDALRHLIGHAYQLAPAGGPALGDDRVHDLAYQARTWTRTARTALTYDVPTIDIPDAWCPECSQQTLTTYADASGDVWCHGTLAGPARPGQRWPIRCAAKYPPGTWTLYLDHLTREDTG
jgi:hypothetical protein